MTYDAQRAMTSWTTEMGSSDRSLSYVSFGQSYHFKSGVAVVTAPVVVFPETVDDSSFFGNVADDSNSKSTTGLEGRRHVGAAGSLWQRWSWGLAQQQSKLCDNL